MTKKDQEKQTDQLTFTEDEVKKTTDFLNLIATSGKFDFDVRQCIRFTELYTHMININKKMEDHIFELRNVFQPSKDKK